MNVTFFQSIKFRIYSFFIGFMVVLCIALFLFMNHNTKEIVMEHEMDQLSGQMNICSELLELKYPGEWTIKDGIMYKGSVAINDNHEFVDYIYDNTGLYCTIFQNDIRITTNILQENERIVGTASSQVVSDTVLISGDDYQGIASVVGTECLTYYTPIYDEDHSIIGMFFLGVSTENAYASLLAFNTKLIMICLGALIAGTIMIILIANVITKPINRIVASVKNLAEGKLNKKIHIESKDELGLISYELITMVTSLNQVLTEIDQLSQRVDAECTLLSETSEQLAQGSTEQAAAVQQLTASTTQIDEQAKQNAKTASSANDLIQQVKENAQIGDGSMHEMQTSMKDIGESSKSISMIIKTIDEIAFQTNILALNAAVEAARAGEHGKGFAVVAAEVRTLAEKSAQAAVRTDSLIQETIQKVNRGLETVGITSERFSSIVSGIEDVGEIVRDVFTASNEQSYALSQINNGLEQISQVTQTISSSSEESAASSSELAQHSHKLRESLRVFTLKKQS